MKKSNLIASIISLIITSLLLVIVIFSWYVTNDRATVTGIVVSSKDNSDEGHLVEFKNNGESAWVLPDELSVMELTISGKTNKAKITFKASDSFKAVTRNSTTNYIENIVTEKTYLKTDESHTNTTTNTDISMLALVDEYYSAMNTSSKVLLNDNQKLEAFTNLYNLSTYHIINNVKVCFLEQEESNLASLIDDVKLGANSTNQWYSLSNQFQVGFDLDSKDDIFEKTIYMYMYFDPTDAYFKSTYHNYVLDDSENYTDNRTYYDINGNIVSVDSNSYVKDKYYIRSAATSDIYFYGQNPFFYQKMEIDLLVV